VRLRTHFAVDLRGHRDLAVPKDQGSTGATGGLAADGLPGSVGLAVCLITPEYVPDEGHHRQRSAGGDAQGHRHLNVMSKGRRARAGTWAGTSVPSCPALAGQAVGHLEQYRADDRERHHRAQDVLGYVSRWPVELARAAKRLQVLGQLPELPTLPAGRPAS